MSTEKKEADDVGGRVLIEVEHFVDREIEAMDESGQWSTHAINALLCLQSRIDAKLRELVGQ